MNCHIGDSTWLAGADDLIIARGSNFAGVTIRTATNAIGQLALPTATPATNNIAALFTHAGTDKLNLGSGGST